MDTLVVGKNRLVKKSRQFASVLPVPIGFPAAKGLPISLFLVVDLAFSMLSHRYQTAYRRVFFLRAKLSVIRVNVIITLEIMTNRYGPINCPNLFNFLIESIFSNSREKMG